MLLFAHGTKKARRGYGKGLSCVNYVPGEYHTVVAHAKGVDTTVVCRAAHKVEEQVAVHVFFRSSRYVYLACALLLCSGFPIVVLDCLCGDQ